jgi:iron(III) transport system substrate-binding protein
MQRTLAALAAALLVAACQPAPAPASRPAAPDAAGAASHSPEVTRLLAAARDAGEVELTLSWGDNELGGSAGSKRLERLFNELYGTSIQVNFTPGPTITEMTSKVSQEVATGRKTSTDLLLGADTHYGLLVERDVLERYEYTRLSDRITPQIVAPNNVGVEIATRLPGIMYNTNLVSPAEAPRTLEAVLDPKWRDIIASTPYAASSDRVAARPEWGPERMKAYVARLSQHIAGLVRCGETSRFMGGEFGMLVMDCGSYDAHKGRAQGGPVAHVIPEDPAVIAVYYLGVPRTAAHPNLAKLYIQMLVREAGQRALYQTEYMDHVGLPGSQSVAELNDVSAKGIAPLKVDARFIAEHPELGKLTEELTAILRERR